MSPASGGFRTLLLSTGITFIILNTIVIGQNIHSFLIIGLIWMRFTNENPTPNGASIFVLCRKSKQPFNEEIFY